jgi:hypothetical protein
LGNGLKIIIFEISAGMKKSIFLQKKKKSSGMQNVSFRNVDEFLEYLPEEERKIVDVLRQIIFSCIPHATEKLNYNVPFYKVNRNICFLWPASVLWGNTKTYKGVRMGFTSGYLLSDPYNYLVKGNRKQVYMHDFNSVMEIDVAILRNLIFEAELSDRKKP